MKKPIRLLIADDHNIVRKGIKVLLATEKDVSLVITDYYMPVMNGVELVQAIRKVLHGGEYISASVADELVFYARHEDDQPLHKYLSDREYQVLCLIASGKEVKEISTELSLSAKTISTYRARLLVKMNMKTNAELTYYAIQNGLV